MSSPMPLFAGMCCICYESIREGDHIVDSEGAKWDVHRGKCADRAGISDGFDSTPPTF